VIGIGLEGGAGQSWRRTPLVSGESPLPQKRLTMRKLKGSYCGFHSLGMSQHQIARSCSISQSTVHDYVCAAQAAGIQWPLPEDWGDPQIGEALFPRATALARRLAQAPGTGLGRYSQGTANPQEPDPATDLAGEAGERPGKATVTAGSANSTDSG